MATSALSHVEFQPTTALGQAGRGDLPHGGCRLPPESGPRARRDSGTGRGDIGVSDVTQLLIDWGRGDRAALDRLMPLVYEELHRLAERYMRRERADHTLQPTALVNEAYLQLIDQKRVQWQNRAHFFGVAAQLMRRITMLHVRKLRAAKRGGGNMPKITLNEELLLPEQRTADLIALDDAFE